MYIARTFIDSNVGLFAAMNYNLTREKKGEREREKFKKEVKAENKSEHTIGEINN